jgi:hypothetical protein
MVNAVTRRKHADSLTSLGMLLLRHANWRGSPGMILQCRGGTIFAYPVHKKGNFRVSFGDLDEF